MSRVDEGPLRYIDSDGHILEPPTAMLDYAPAEYRDRIWHCETDSDGVEWIVWDGQRSQAGGLAGTAGFSDEMVERVRNFELTYSQTRPSGWTGVSAARGPRPRRYRALGAVPDDDARAPEPA